MNIRFAFLALALGLAMVFPAAKTLAGPDDPIKGVEGGVEEDTGGEKSGASGEGKIVESDTDGDSENRSKDPIGMDGASGMGEFSTRGPGMGGDGPVGP